MKIEIKKVDACKREMAVELQPETTKLRSEALLERLSKELSVPGFRPGKATKDAIKRHLGKQRFEEEFIKDTIPDVYKETLAKENIDAIGLPEISDINFKEDKFSFKAIFEIRPQVELKNYKGLKVKRKEVEVTQKDIDGIYESFKKHYKVETVDDRIVKGLGFSSIAEFEDSMKRQLLMRKEQEARQDVELQITKQLLDMHDFSLPSLLVRQEEESLKEAARKQLKSAGLKQEDIDLKMKEAENEFAAEAKKRIKLFLIFDAISHEEKIEEEQDYNFNKVMEFLLREADWGTAKKGAQ